MSTIGRPLARVDGPAKVTGTARYAADVHLEGLTHGALVRATVTRGRITGIDASAAEAVPGVLGVFSHLNLPRYAGAPHPFPWGKSHYPLQDDRVHYAGQHVAFVVAETPEQARHAAGLVRVDYAAEPASVRVTRPDRGSAAAEHVIDAVYSTPMQHHNTMEPSATTAVWDGDELTLYDAAQSMSWIRQAVAATLAMPEEKVRIVAPYLGGAFGCKGLAWPHVFATAVVARAVGRPVRLVLTRAQTYTSHGHRAEAVHTIRLTSDVDGRLRSLAQTVTSQSSSYDPALCYEGLDASGYLYTVATEPELAQRPQVLDVDTPAALRPPEGPGNFVLESAMDELSYVLGVDPLELRRRNHTDRHPDGTPYGTGKYLLDCYEQGARRFGWHRRKPAPRSTRRGGFLVGQGMATAVHASYSAPARALTRLTPDGRALVRSGTQEIGGGTYTTMPQVATDALGMAPGAVRFELGDTWFPPAPTTSGSMTSISVGEAVHHSGMAARTQAIALAVADPASPLHGVSPADVRIQDGRLLAPNGRGETYRQLLSRNDRTIETTGDFTGDGLNSHSWGAVFTEVEVDELTGEVRVARLTAVFDCGRILNPLTARAQGIGGAVWGIGFALTEHTLLDRNLGRILTPNLSGYLVPTEADVPTLDIHFVNHPDPTSNALGVRGMGEVVATGIPAAIGNAVFHATGVRVRDLPITPDKLL